MRLLGVLLYPRPFQQVRKLIFETVCYRSFYYETQTMEANPFDDSIFPEFLNTSNATSVITSSKTICASSDTRNHSIQVMLDLPGQSDIIFGIAPSDHQLDNHLRVPVAHHAEDIGSIFNTTSPSMANTVITTQAIMKPKDVPPSSTNSQQSPTIMSQHIQKLTSSSMTESVTTTTEDKIKQEVDTTCNIQTSGK